MTYPLNALIRRNLKRINMLAEKTLNHKGWDEIHRLSQEIKEAIEAKRLDKMAREALYRKYGI